MTALDDKHLTSNNHKNNSNKRSVISKEICELRNIINVGYLIMRQAMERKESRGLHYNLDHPRKDS